MDVFKGDEDCLLEHAFIADKFRRFDGELRDLVKKYDIERLARLNPSLLNTHIFGCVESFYRQAIDPYTCIFTINKGGQFYEENKKFLEEKRATKE